MPNGQMEAMNHRKATLSDPEHARVAWARYRKLMKWMLGAAIAAVVASLVYLGSGGGPLPVHMVIATIAGVRADGARLSELGIGPRRRRRRFVGRPQVSGSREAVLRVVPRPGDINTNGHIFGGWVLSQMDIAGGIIAGREADGPVATVAIEAMQFIEPILLLDVVSIYAWVERRGRTSVAIRIEVIASRDRGTRDVKVTEGLFTFVALDENHRPRPLPGL
jgi:acyl-CoA thioesterase YciA